MDMKTLVPLRTRSNLARADYFPFDALRREVDGLFFDFAHSLGIAPTNGSHMLAPKMEVAETDKEIQISAELPGLERKDIDISLDANVLTIRAERRAEKEEDQKDKNVHVSERSYGVFYRAIELPTSVDPSTVQATMSNGVLKIVIPKPPQAEAKKIEIKQAA
jgi:HSP20 family protein